MKDSGEAGEAGAAFDAATEGKREWRAPVLSEIEFAATQMNFGPGTVDLGLYS
jgi:hypothetical protein